MTDEPASRGSSTSPSPRQAGPLEWLVHGLQWVVIAGMGLLVVDVLWGVVARYALRTPSQWTDEVATSLMIWVSLLGAALAYRDRSHLGVDYLAMKLDPEARRLLRYAVHLLVLAFAVWVMIRGGVEVIIDRIDRGQVLPSLGISKAWVYVPVPASGAFICLFVFEAIWLLWRSPTVESLSEQGTSGA